MKLRVRPPIEAPHSAAPDRTGDRGPPVPPAGRIWRKTSCWRGFTLARPVSARVVLRRSLLVAPRGLSWPRRTVMAKLCTPAQQAGSSKSVRPLLSSSMQLAQISRRPGDGIVVVVVEQLPKSIVQADRQVRKAPSTELPGQWASPKSLPSHCSWQTVSMWPLPHSEGQSAVVVVVVPPGRVVVVVLDVVVVGVR